MWLRLLAGEAFGLRAAVKTHSPQFYAHATLEAGARIALPSQHAERAAYLTQYTGAISRAYPALADGSVLLPFPRLFIVAIRAV